MEKTITQFSVSVGNSECSLIRKRALSKKNRNQKIRDKDFIYPKSTSDKIVFIVNKYGNGFCREKLSDFSIPNYVPLQSMFQQINRVCEDHWAKFHYHAEDKIYYWIKIGLFILVLIILVILVGHVVFIAQQMASGFQICNYLTYCVLTILLIIAIITGSKEREQVDIEQSMIRVIKHKLNEINQREEIYYGQKLKFKWTCHAQCLWIALNL